MAIYKILNIKEKNTQWQIVLTYILNGNEIFKKK